MFSTQHIPRNDARLVEPHKRLMAAVLQTVVDDCHGTVHRRAAGTKEGPTTGTHDVHHAIAYATSKDREWPFSFENLCDALDIDAGCFRHELRKERET